MWERMSSTNCSCANGATCQGSPACCRFSIGFQFLGGGTRIMIYIVQISGTYNISGTTVSGNPPSSFVIFLNGTKVASFNGSGGSASVSANVGDVITVSVNWGAFYQGGTVEVCIMSPTPTPIPSSPPPSIPSTMLLIIFALIFAIVLIIFLYLYIRS